MNIKNLSNDPFLQDEALAKHTNTEDIAKYTAENAKALPKNSFVDSK